MISQHFLSPGNFLHNSPILFVWKTWRMKKINYLRQNKLPINRRRDVAQNPTINAHNIILAELCRLLSIRIYIYMCQMGFFFCLIPFLYNIQKHKRITATRKSLSFGSFIRFSPDSSKIMTNNKEYIYVFFIWPIWCFFVSFFSGFMEVSEGRAVVSARV